MTGTEISIFFTDCAAMVFIIMVVAVSSGAVAFIMLHDYRFFLDNHRRKKFSLADFLKREQFYVYLLLFFLLLIGIELWMQMQA